VLQEWKQKYEELKKDPAKPRPTEGLLRRLLNSIERE